MSRWIDAEWLMNFFVDIPNNFTLTIGNLRATVDNAPTIEIIRCGECRYWHSGECWGIPYRGDYDTSIDTKADDFCSYGEREGE